MKSLFVLAALAAAPIAATPDPTYCPNIFYQAGNLILQSPFLLSQDASVTNACHSCIAKLAAQQTYAPLCYVIGMPGYDPAYSIAQDCHCLSLGLTEACAQACLPNPICSASSMRAECTACVAKNAPSTCDRNAWSLPCYETCQNPSCITECSAGPQCHPSDAICAACVSQQSASCSTSVASYGRPWSAACTAGCYSSTCAKQCNRVCGDGFLTADEQCDDGNTDPGDGCAPNCQIEPNFACTGTTTSTCHLGSCGDGVLEGKETCDDGNHVSGDGCSSACQVEVGASCTGTPSRCTAVCGDGVLASGLEGCDDGNLTSATGAGYSCAATTARKSQCTPVCGDGYVLPNVERCDDGNTASTSTCAATCGDGVVAFPIEACDDGNHISGDGCSYSCSVEEGFQCAGTAPSTCAPVCGDSRLEGTEACDDGNTLDGDGCDPYCAIETGWACSNVDAPNSVCKPICGDDMVTGWEECDGTTPGCVNCKRTTPGPSEYEDDLVLATITKPPPRCGNAILETGERCDDGNTKSGDGCTSTCTIEPGYVCRGTNCFGVCGNSIKTTSEGCDDGNTRSGDGCSGTCAVETGYRCTVTSAGRSSCSPLCGDGRVLSPETCDDANAVAGDGCSSTCTVEAGFRCRANANGVSSCTPICGDGIKAASEACDDGNTRAGDGCSATCTIERGFACSGTKPSLCAAVCGDGIVAGSEACDVGNTAGTAGCSSTCRLVPGFQCSGSPSVCSRGVSCGDGIVSPGEQCDDGNTKSGDGCSHRCRTEALYTCNGSAPSTCVKSNCRNIRRDWAALSAQDKANFMTCVDRMFQSGYYQKLTGVHVYRPNDQYAHHTNGFVQWHRKWLLMVQNLLRSMGGVCACMDLPYWDWTRDAANMQSNGCRNKLECHPVLREWGGGGSTRGTYKTVPVYNDPARGSPSGRATGYCVVNDITRNWRAGMTLGRFSTAYDPNCPVLRRGWGDTSDDSGYYSVPMATTSFLRLASNLARATSYRSFIPIALGDIHVLPHNNNGGFLTTFISPADPVFLLHHGNVDRVYALWEACHGCTRPSRTTRTVEGTCYVGSNSGDGINEEMSFLTYDDIGGGRYNIVASDVATDFAEWMPQGFRTPGDMMDTTSLGEYAYRYGSNAFDSQLWTASGCSTKQPSAVLLAEHPNFVALKAAADMNATSSYNDAETTKYLDWVQNLLDKVRSFVTSLQQSNLFSLPFAQGLLGHLASLDMYVVDVAATCECMHVNKLLLGRSAAGDYSATCHDVSPAFQRHWNKTFRETRSCFHRLHNADEVDVLQRRYCDVILNPNFDAALQSFLADVTSALAPSLLESLANYLK
ncbi:hypothetical protein SPRG_09889 [Saprolegnia parasitica CBS 223.65]|uniref:Tyrosinase copper-binding domain-containing protein n=1 Tax=Saprolegnia parasitica (strain CBS 223.65) TaxID=695850 RepID=A0A067C173_SAPPC|nr:hypothetical protein SPRG_09889 [Saprolegnia parasitica CBS 223.65]KDO24253.1 hypothetical protein SPRG_09889 [Saprolegnia parasitica CBS 223.65]|eukprot:XP_012205028.1 hypothetical protein SPRG_09889 [Saprolegnia parasitica CBS 223.65]